MGVVRSMVIVMERQLKARSNRECTWCEVQSESKATEAVMDYLNRSFRCERARRLFLCALWGLQIKLVLLRINCLF